MKISGDHIFGAVRTVGIVIFVAAAVLFPSIGHAQGEASIFGASPIRPAPPFQLPRESAKH